MDQPFHSVLDVPVNGGTLAVAVSGPASGAPVLLGVHGITGSHRAWTAVARHLGDDITFVAPDLRGRGASQLPGPYGLSAHVEDLVAVLDHVGAAAGSGTPLTPGASGTPRTPGASGTPRTPGVVLAGHSMGAYIVARLAAAHLARTAGVALVDGGLVL
ncbi:MAG: alpha/beta fold hydrolase, partial [Actinomycetota bacterium]|nr:alpha/beta fold hydrolase [Actinomycetota bacterium]